MLVTVSTALNAIPADIAAPEAVPCACNANATAALAMPMLPGVRGARAASEHAEGVEDVSDAGVRLPVAGKYGYRDRDCHRERD
jgi:hypothetical protein